MDQTHAPAPVSLREATRFWFRLGLISFGGPAGQIAIMHAELVERRRWISERRFLHALNYCLVLPGPEAQQLATYIGWLLHGRRGGLVAGWLFVLPAFVLFLLLGWLYMEWGQQPLAAAALYGIRPVVVAIVFGAALRIGRKTLHHPLLWGVAVLALLLVSVIHTGFPWIVAGAALLGALTGRWQPGLFAAASLDAADRQGAALLDDDTPLAEHMRFSPLRLAGVLLGGVGVWGGLLGTLVAAFGLAAPYTRMALFFSKAALLTFGGAYAVLPYVFQGAVLDQHWLSAQQMLDGLALGETTPGPLLMVLTFVGFVGGWSHSLLASPLLSALLAATVVTLVTYMPSFFFIFLGGPLVEAGRQQPYLAAPLTCITAAVVGVIAHLGVFLAGQVFWPAAGTLDGEALLLALLAFAALQSQRVGLPLVIAAGALAGLLLRGL